MLMRTDPFQLLDRLTQQWFRNDLSGSRAMPMDAYRSGDEFVVQFDLPGVSTESIDVDVQDNVLTVKAQRRQTADDKVETVLNERPTGSFSRQLFLGDNLDTDDIKADYAAGVLTLRIPVAERAKPRKIAINAGAEERRAIKT
ncbi:Hsp20/alpha crystallin family protein [Saccharothrix deserti]|uniref:Hsp20/alpha crystallin family protein n=1 Tax=Saccharothrix deserti TaxID=2593674 RepID=UPI00131D7D7D|nr:Hsp20/alpha crystallin family protein [Saccharothrix deserti]